MSTILLGVSGGIAAYKAVDVLRLLQRDGHDGHRSAGDDFLDARPESPDLAVGGNATFREYTDDIARRELGVHFCECLVHEPLVFPRGSDRNRLRMLEQETQQRELEDLVVHDEANGPAHRSGNQQRIEAVLDEGMPHPGQHRPP